MLVGPPPLLTILLVAHNFRRWALYLSLLAGNIPCATLNSDSATTILGAGDVLSIRALHVPELPDKPFRLDETGNIPMPFGGTVQAIGLTAQQLAARIKEVLAIHVRRPEVSVELVERKSRPVSVLGSVRAPGVYQIPGRQRLLDVLSMAGGLDQEAGNSIIVARGETVRREIPLDDLIESRNPELNIFIEPQDTITIPRGKFVYVVGEVRKAGGFPIREKKGLTVLRAVALAEGLTGTAAAKEARVIRGKDTPSQQEIAVNVRDILAGKKTDVQLLPDDVLFIPNSLTRRAGLRALDAAIYMGTGVVIWRR